MVLEDGENRQLESLDWGPRHPSISIRPHVGCQMASVPAESTHAAMFTLRFNIGVDNDWASVGAVPATAGRCVAPMSASPCAFVVSFPWTAVSGHEYLDSGTRTSGSDFRFTCLAGSGRVRPAS